MPVDDDLETAAGSNRLTIIDEITNLAGVPGELELLYHTNMGRPFLEPGARFVAPIVAVVPRDAVMLSLTFDHRVVDGASGAAFLQTLKALLEEPVRLLF